MADEQKTLGAAVSKKTQATDNKATTNKTGLNYKSSCCCINLRGDAVSETRRGSLVDNRPSTVMTVVTVVTIVTGVTECTDLA